MKQPTTTRRQRALTNAPTGRRQPPPPPAVQYVNPRATGFFRWLSTSRLLLIVGVIIAATILTVMYYRITQPTQSATPTAIATPVSFMVPLASPPLA